MKPWQNLPCDITDTWPVGRTCLAAWDPGVEELFLLEVDGRLVYADPDDAPEQREYSYCPACDYELSEAEHNACHDPDGMDTCPQCGVTNHLDVLRADGVRIL